MVWDQVQSSTGHIRPFLSTFVLLWFVMVCFHNEAHWIPLCSGPFLNRYLGGFADAQKGIAQSLESSSHVASFVRPWRMILPLGMCPFSQGWKLHGEGHADEQLQNVCLGVFWLGAQFRCLRSRAQLYSALSDDLSISFQEVWWCPMCPMCNRCVHRTVMWKAEKLQRTSKTSCWVVATWSSWRPLFHRNVFLVEAAFASLRVHLYKSGMFWTFLDYPKELEIST